MKDWRFLLMGSEWLGLGIALVFRPRRCRIHRDASNIVRVWSPVRRSAEYLFGPFGSSGWSPLAEPHCFFYMHFR